MSNFDLSSLALASAFPTNKILTDDKGLPSVMVYIPKFKMSSTEPGTALTRLLLSMELKRTAFTFPSTRTSHTTTEPTRCRVKTRK